MTLTGMSTVASRAAVARARTRTLYVPSASALPSKITLRGPARRQVRGSSSATVAPPASTTVTVTFASTFSVNEIVAVSACPSPFGDVVAGIAVAFASWSVPTTDVPRVPVAAVAPAVSMRHLAPATGPVGTQVQSTFAPVPSLRATSAPSASVTTTDQGRAEESRAVKRVPPVSSGAATGA